MSDLLETPMSRRNVLQAATASALTIDPALRAAVYAQGSDKPEKEEVKIGFIPLTDCSSVVMANVMEFDKKYGIKIIPSKEASWAGVRDKLVNGDLHMAHVLYGLIYGVQMGIGGPKKDMAVLMSLNNNGQAITLSKALADKKAVDGASLAKLMSTEKRDYTFAQTFPTGTHAMSTLPTSASFSSVRRWPMSPRWMVCIPSSSTTNEVCLPRSAPRLSSR
mgnify:CR=1 FL=1